VNEDDDAAPASTAAAEPSTAAMDGDRRQFCHDVMVPHLPSRYSGRPG
jgi:hypothetical protein